MRAKSERLDDRKRLTCSSTEDTTEVVLLPTVGAAIWGCEVPLLLLVGDVPLEARYQVSM
jgi:hypothetical protein